MASKGLGTASERRKKGLAKGRAATKVTLILWVVWKKGTHHLEQPNPVPPAEEIPAGHWEHSMDIFHRGGPVPVGHQEAPPGVIPAALLHQHLIPCRTHPGVL